MVENKRRDGYRELGDPNAGAIESRQRKLDVMLKKINAEGLMGIEINTSSNEGALLTSFINALDTPVGPTKITPEKIALFSLETGVLKYSNKIKKNRAETIFIYNNPDHPEAQAIIEINTELNIAFISDIAPLRPETHKTEKESPEQTTKETKEKKPERELSIQEMRAIVATENKIGIEITKDISSRDKDNPFRSINEILSNANQDDINTFKPDDFIIYSEQFGILRFSHRSEPSEPVRTKTSTIDFTWVNETAKITLVLSYHEAGKIFYLKHLKEKKDKKL